MWISDSCNPPGVGAVKSAAAPPQGFTGGDSTEISEVEVKIRSSESKSLLYIYFTVVVSLVPLAQKQLLLVAGVDQPSSELLSFLACLLMLTAEVCNCHTSKGCSRGKWDWLTQS